MTVSFRREIVVAASTAELWPLLSDTDRVNRLLGQGEVRYEATTGDSLARFIGETHAAGLRLRYEELPFEVEAPRRYRITRRMLGGPLRHYVFGVELLERGEGTLVVMTLDLEPRAAWAAPLAWVVGRLFSAKYTKFVEQTQAHLRDHAPHPFEQPVTPIHQAELAARRKQLLRAGVADERGARLADYLTHAADADVAKIRPYDLADAWSIPRHEALSILLEAVTAGMLELRFGVVCPSCLVPSDTVASLADLEESGHCNACDLRFGLDLDRAIEVLFHVHPALRPTPTRVFCMGAPARTPHVLVQRHLPAQGAVELLAPVDEGRYQVFVRGGITASLEVSTGAGAREELVLDAQGLRPAQLTLAPGGVLVLDNQTGVELHAKLQRLDYATSAATVHHLASMPAFRRSFSKELLKPGTPLKVANVVLLFSDLTGSTALYSSVGDAAAFRFVDDHFDVLRAAIEDERGVIIKTMGDAIMASFLDTSSALRAARQALVRFDAWRATLEHGERVGLKLGVHSGPCYVISANGSLDYFGQTVNVAARLQGLAQSGELVMAAALAEQLPPGALEGLREHAVAEAQLKGVEGATRILRLVAA